MWNFPGLLLTRLAVSPQVTILFTSERGLGKTFSLLGSDEEHNLEMYDLDVAVVTNSLDHNTEISNTVLGKDGNVVVPSCLPASQAIGTSASNADLGSIDFG